MKVEDLQHRIEAYSPELRLLIELSGKAGMDRLKKDKTDPGHTEDNKLENEGLKNIHGGQPIYLENINWEYFAQLAASHKLTSLVFPFLEQLKPEIPEETYQKIKSGNVQHTRRSLRQIEQTIHLQELFNEEKIPAVFFKGIVLSQRLYDNPTAKNSIDIDLLMPLEYVEKAAGMLRERGYRMTYPAISMTPKQTQINYGISHHYGFHHYEKGVHLELHWNLTNPRSLLPLHFGGLYQRAGQIHLKDHPVTTLSDADYLSYLAVHGARHQWSRLNWLLDFAQLLNQTAKEEHEKARLTLRNLGMEKCFQQACLMSHLIYGIPESQTELQTDQLRQKFIEKPLKALKESKSPEALEKLKDLPYNLSLRRAFKYKFNLLFRWRTHHTNWAQIKLPDHLFFLYYPLRPILWIKDILFRKK